MRVRRIIQLLAVLLAAVMMVSCSRPSGGSSEPSDQGAERKVLEVGATGEPAGMDMITVDGAGTPFVLLYNVYETLVKLDAERNVKPLLATEWEMSPDRLTYTFHLDPQAKFADGSPVDAAAVVASFQRIIDGAGTGQVKGNFAPLKAVRAVEDKVVELELHAPSNYFLLSLTTPAGIVVNPAADVASLNETPAGSGPYQLGEWEPGSKVSLVRNEQYWGTPPHYDEVNFRYYADPNAMNTAMLSGQLDIISNLTVPQSIGQFADTSKYTVHEGVTDGEVLLSFNNSNPALAKREVRQAIHHAIDRQAVVDAAWGGKGELIGSMVPPGEPWYEDLSDTYPYDPEKAKELLAQAGHAQGLTLRLRVPSLPYAPPAARSIQSQLRAVGIEVEIEELDFARWLDVVFSQGDYDMTIVAHVEPRDLRMFAREGNYLHYSNPDFDKLMQEADEGDETAFVEKQKEAARLLTADAPVDWLFLLPNIIVTTPDIDGVQADQTSLSFDVTLLASSR